jgi:acyl-[acyl-carrier-protein]-phospholipid O-acyltransferase/long-chain-fatty-acid--[acyl-carrier-protein] ligase
MISLQQVENVVAQCLGTPEVAAIATGDKRKGEQIIVCTTAPDVSVKQIRDFISAAHLSPLLVPSQVIHVDAIPFLGSGKTDYVTLTDTVAQIK